MVGHKIEGKATALLSNFFCRKNWLWDSKWVIGMQEAPRVCSTGPFQRRAISKEDAWGTSYLKAITLKLAYGLLFVTHFWGMACVNWELLQYYRGGVEMNRRDFLSGRWAPYLERALVIKPCYNGALNGGQVNRLIFYSHITTKSCCKAFNPCML